MRSSLRSTRAFLLLTALMASVSVATAQDLIQRGKGANRRSYIESLQRLHATVFDPRFEDPPLGEFFKFVARSGEVNVVVHPKADIEEATVTLNLKRFRLLDALELVLDQHDLRAVYRHGVFVVVPKEEAGQNLVLRIYSIQDMLVAIRDFPGPDMNLKPTRSGFFDEPEKEEPLTAPVTGDEVVDMIEEYTGGESWSDNPRAKVTIYNGLLVVRQSESVHREIRKLLAGLRGTR